MRCARGLINSTRKRCCGLSSFRAARAESLERDEGGAIKCKPSDDQNPQSWCKTLLAEVVRAVCVMIVVGVRVANGNVG